MKMQPRPDQHLLVTEFLAYGRDVLAYSVHTVKGYRSSLNAFALYMAEKFPEVELRNAYAPHLIGYDQSCSRKLRPRSRARNIAAIRAFYLWLTEEHEPRLAKNPSLRLKPPELDGSSRSCPLRDVREKLIEATDRLRSDRDCILARAMLGTIFNAGLRPEEICALQLGDVILQEAGSFLVVQAGKGRKRREVPLCGDLVEWLRAWLKIRHVVPKLKRNSKSPIEPTPAFFVHGARMRPMTQYTLRAILGHVKAAAGVRDPNLTPHSLRHSFATTLDEEGEDITVIQELMGHQSAATTRCYIHPSSKRKFAAVERLNRKPAVEPPRKIKPIRLLKRQR